MAGSPGPTLMGVRRPPRRCRDSPDPRRGESAWAGRVWTVGMSAIPPRAAPGSCSRIAHGRSTSPRPRRRSRWWRRARSSSSARSDGRMGAGGTRFMGGLRRSMPAPLRRRSREVARPGRSRIGAIAPVERAMRPDAEQFGNGQLAGGRGGDGGWLGGGNTTLGRPREVQAQRARVNVVDIGEAWPYLFRYVERL